MDAWVLLIAMGISIIIYFIPAMIAKFRGSARTGGIFLLNLLAGATGVGWVAALVWALSSETKQDRERRRLVEDKILSAR